MIVAGLPACTPLEFRVSVQFPEELALDEVVFCQREVAPHGTVTFFGVVDSVEVSDPPLSYVGKVRITRIEPEIFVPPLPGLEVRRAQGEQLTRALHFDGMRHKLPLGILGSGDVAFANLAFLSGEKGAHVNIAGISGVATKTSYALFLLYSLFHCPQKKAPRAILFNVKGDDLLYLDRPNSALRDQDRVLYEKMGLPCGPFPEVAYHGVKGGLWTMREFAELGLMQFLFVDTEASGPQDFAIEKLVEMLKLEAARQEGPELVVMGKKITRLEQLSDLICENEEEWFEKAAPATRQALVRRLKSAVRHVGPLLRSKPEGTSFHYESQLNVVDLHNCHDRARAFVVGSVLKILFDRREKLGDQHPPVYLLLDELNKYAPRDSNNAIKEMLLDVAERGRSLGLILLGAEQTASAVEARVVGNAALRVVGRLEPAESLRDEYTWLSPSLRERACLTQPGTMILAQPEVPRPLLVRFPFPAWATRSSEVAAE